VRRSLLVFVGTGLLSVLSLSAEAQLPGLYVSGGFAQAGPSGTESLTRNPGSTQPSVVNGVDVKESLGFADRTSYFAEARYQFERWRVEAAYREAHYSGTWSVVPAPRSVEVDWSVLSFGVRGDVVSKPVYALALGLDVDQVRHDSYSAPATSSGSPLWNREDESSPTKAIPFVAVALRNPEGRLWLDLKAGMSLFDGGAPAQKARVEAGWLITSGFGVKGGWDYYRFQKAWSEGAVPREIDFRVSGLYGGLVLMF
jgi:hypothetical protein